MTSRTVTCARYHAFRSPRAAFWCACTCTCARPRARQFIHSFTHCVRPRQDVSAEVSRGMPSTWTPQEFLSWNCPDPAAGDSDYESGSDDEVESCASSHDSSMASADDIVNSTLGAGSNNAAACGAAGDDTAAFGTAGDTCFHFGINGLSRFLEEAESRGDMEVVNSVQAGRRFRAMSKRAPSRASLRIPSLRVPSASDVRDASASSGRASSKRSSSTRKSSSVSNNKRLRITPRALGARAPTEMKKKKKEKKVPRGREVKPISPFVMKPGVQYVGRYEIGEQRQARIARFMEKRKCRVWTRKIGYPVRKRIADARTRGTHGKFARPSLPLMDTRPSIPPMDARQSIIPPMDARPSIIPPMDTRPSIPPMECARVPWALSKCDRTMDGSMQYEYVI